LCRCGHIAIDGEMGEKGFDLACSHVLWVSLAMEHDETLDPVNVRLLGANAVMFATDRVADLIEYSRCGGRVRHVKAL